MDEEEREDLEHIRTAADQIKIDRVGRIITIEFPEEEIAQQAERAMKLQFRAMDMLLASLQLDDDLDDNGGLGRLGL